MLPVHHRYVDALAVLVLAGLLWRFNRLHWALAANRARAMRWSTRAGSAQARGSLPCPNW
jgi:hypothetical protein